MGVGKLAQPDGGELGFLQRLGGPCQLPWGPHPGLVS